MRGTEPHYRQKQAFLCFLVFCCLALAGVGQSAPVAVGALLAAALLCFLAARLQPQKPEEPHHH